MLIFLLFYVLYFDFWGNTRAIVHRIIFLHRRYLAEFWIPVSSPLPCCVLTMQAAVEV
jgi:hypothetical protein